VKKAKRQFWVIWAVVTISSFGLLYAGVRLLLGNPVNMQNIMAYIIISLTFGIISGALFLFKRKYAFILFIAGLAVGFFEMSRLFLGNSGGWGDLIGLISLFTWAAIGLAGGAVVELCRVLYRKINPGQK
jgi:hypothetical protein